MKSLFCNKNLILTLCSSFIFIATKAQLGKNGAVTITTNTTSINPSANLLTDVTAGATSIIINSNPGLSAGDLVFIIQMQGAAIDGTPGNTWGNITNYNSSGLNEFAEIASVNGSTVNFLCGLKNSYSSTGKVQVIKVPRYTSFTLNAGVTLQPNNWNGSTGGILVMEVSGNAIINGTINVSGKGFRGGAGDNQAAFPGTNLYASTNSGSGAEKGESIAGYQSGYDSYGGRYSYGAPANGGGGGSSHNAGGGGGANGGIVGSWTGNGNPDNSTVNYISAWNAEAPGFAASASSGGGRGGYSFVYFQNLPVVDPLIYGPGDPAYTFTDNRRNVGGKGGRPLDYSAGRLFFGGGGGAGDANDGIVTNGGNGGGLIYIRTCGDIAGSGTILANGTNGDDAVILGGNDAPGGGGAGGTIVLNASGTVAGTLAITANGGRGGNQNLTIAQLEAEGPGGGGGGGVVLLSGGSPLISVNGGINGITNAPAVSAFPPNGATKGGIGSIGAITQSIPANVLVNNRTICYGNTANLNASVSGGGSPTITWYADPSGTVIHHQGASFTTPPLFADTVYYVGISCNGNLCGALNLIPDTVFVKPVVAKAGRDTSFCSGGVTVLGTSSSAGYTYQWTPAAGLSSAVVSNPTLNLTNTGTTNNVNTYIVSVSNAGCVAKDTVIVTVNPYPIANAGRDTTVCSGSRVQIGSNENPAYTYSWSPLSSGLSGSNPVITLNNNGSTAISNTYTLTTSINTCSSSDDVIVNISPTPSSDAGEPLPEYCFTTQNVTLGVEPDNAINYSWIPIDGLSSSNSSNPILKLSNDGNSILTQTYTITASNSFNCSSSDSITVIIHPKIIVKAGPPAEICEGESVKITAEGGMNYQWNTDETSASIIVSPTKTTTYYVTATNKLCAATDSVTIKVKGSGSGRLYIPNAFTPNEDTNNDFFKVISDNPTFTSFKGMIFNRWGELYYEWDNINDGWNGYYKGNIVQEDVYIYKIIVENSCKDHPKPIIGNITVLK